MPAYSVEPYGSHWLLTIGKMQQAFVAYDDAENEGKRLIKRQAYPPIAWVRIASHCYPIPHGARPTRCASCGASVVWTRTAAGQPIPLSLDTARDHNGRRVADSHFTDCPHAKEWSEQ